MPFSSPCISMPIPALNFVDQQRFSCFGMASSRSFCSEGLGAMAATWSWCWRFKGQWWSIQVSKHHDISWRIHYRYMFASKWKLMTPSRTLNAFLRHCCIFILLSSRQTSPISLCHHVRIETSCELKPARHFSPIEIEWNRTLLGSFCGPVAPNAYRHRLSSPSVAVRFNCFKSSRYWSKATPHPSAEESP